MNEPKYDSQNVDQEYDSRIREIIQEELANGSSDKVVLNACELFDKAQREKPLSREDITRITEDSLRS